MRVPVGSVNSSPQLARAGTSSRWAQSTAAHSNSPSKTICLMVWVMPVCLNGKDRYSWENSLLAFSISRSGKMERGVTNNRRAGRKNSNTVDNHFRFFLFLRDALLFQTLLTWKPMTFLEQVVLLKRMDALIKRKSTGTPFQLARRLNISRSSVHNYIKILKEFGAPVVYCNRSRSYIYTKRFTLDFNNSVQLF